MNQQILGYILPFFFKLTVLYFSWIFFRSIIIYNTTIILELVLRTNTFIDFLKLTGGKPLLKCKPMQNNKTNQESPQIKPISQNKHPKTHYTKKAKPKKPKKPHLRWSHLCKEGSILLS